MERSPRKVVGRPAPPAKLHHSIRQTALRNLTELRPGPFWVIERNDADLEPALSRSTGFVFADMLAATLRRDAAMTFIVPCSHSVRD